MENKYYRSKANFDPDLFLHDLQEVLSLTFGIDTVVDQSNFDVLFDQMLQIIKNTLNVHAPLRKYSRKQRRLKTKHWITKAILKSVKHKQKLHTSHFINGNDELKQYYKRYSYILARIKERSKSLHYQIAMNDAKHDSCGTWRVIKELLTASPKQANHSISLIKNENKTLIDAEDIANAFNNYYWRKTCQKY